MNKLIIDRSKWRTGYNGPTKTGVGQTALENEYGFRCCLGFYCLQAGFNKIKGEGEPVDLNELIPHLTVLTLDDYNDEYFASTDLTKNAIIINDDESTTIQEKEEKLTALFATVGVEVVFEGEPTYIS